MTVLTLQALHVRLAAMYWMRLLLFVGMLAGSFAWAKDPVPTVFVRTTPHFKVALEPLLTPLEINQIHAWEIQLRGPDDEPIEGAEIEVSGGMPQHDHGLPTRPRVTRYLGEGRYLVEGMRFHMPGEWLLVVDISRDSARERIELTLNLP